MNLRTEKYRNDAHSPNSTISSIQTRWSHRNYQNLSVAVLNSNSTLIPALGTWSKHKVSLSCTARPCLNTERGGAHPQLQHWEAEAGGSVCLQGQPGSRGARSRTARATYRGCLKKAKQNKDLSLKVNVDEKGNKNDWLFWKWVKLLQFQFPEHAEDCRSLLFCEFILK